MTEKLTLSVEEAGELLGIGRSAAYGAAWRGELPVVRVGRRLLIPQHRLHRMLGLEGEEAAPTKDGPTAQPNNSLSREFYADDGP